METEHRGGFATDVPQTKKFVNYLIFAATGLSVLVLALCAYSISVWKDWWFDILTPALSFMLFACVWTWLFLAAWILLPRRFTQFYNKWVVVGLFSLTVFFWLVAWALLAARVSASKGFDSLGSIYDSFSLDLSDFNIVKRAPRSRSSTSSGITRGSDNSFKKLSTAWKIAAAAAGIGALIWVLLTVALVFFGLAIHQSRSAGDAYEGGEPKPMPPAAPVGGAGHEMNQYGSPTSATPNPEQQFVHGQQYPQQYDQSAYGQNQGYQQQPQQQQHIPV